MYVFPKRTEEINTIRERTKQKKEFEPIKGATQWQGNKENIVRQRSNIFGKYFYHVV